MGGCCWIIAADGTKAKGPDVTNNFHIRPFFYLGTKFYSVEQGFQAHKFAMGSPTFQAVASLVPHEGESDSAHGHRAWGAGQGGSLRANWNAIKVGLMLALVRARTAQHADLRAQLLGTGTAPILGKPSTNWNHGGLAWNWSQFNGLIMMLVREELVREEAGGAAQLGALEMELRAALEAYESGTSRAALEAAARAVDGATAAAAAAAAAGGEGAAVGGAAAGAAEPAAAPAAGGAAAAAQPAQGLP